MPPEVPSGPQREKILTNMNVLKIHIMFLKVSAFSHDQIFFRIEPFAELSLLKISLFVKF